MSIAELPSMSMTLGPLVLASAIDGSRYSFTTLLNGGKQRPEVKRTSEMSVLSSAPKSRHCLNLLCQPFLSFSSAASRFAATSGVAPSALKKFDFSMAKRGMRSTTNGKVSCSGKVASRVRTNW